MNVLIRGCRGNDVKLLQNALHVLPDGIFGELTQEAVKDFQKANGLTVDGVVGPATWSKLITGGDAVPKRSCRNIKEIIIHCSDTREGQDFTVEDIRKWHKARGFNDIGYHYVIYRDGTVALGRDVNIAGAHCTGHNTISIGVCYIGGHEAVGKGYKDTRTDAQKRSMLELLKRLKKLYPKATIHGHNEFANKACPCFNVKKEYGNM